MNQNVYVNSPAPSNPSGTFVGRIVAKGNKRGLNIKCKMVPDHMGRDRIEYIAALCEGDANFDIMFHASNQNTFTGIFVGGGGNNGDNDEWENARLEFNSERTLLSLEVLTTSNAHLRTGTFTRAN